MMYPFERPVHNLEAWEKINTALKTARDSIIAGACSRTELKQFCACAAVDAKTFGHDEEKLSWGFDEPSTMPSDARCEFFYLPTYLMVQCMIAAVMKEPELMESPVIRDTLHRGLNGCTARSLLGHGYDDVPVLYENLQMFLEAGYTAFAMRYPKISPDFRKMFMAALADVKKSYENGRHAFGWSPNQKNAQEAILNAIRRKIPGDLTCEPGYRLYIAYGSNMDEERMADRCPGAELVGIGTLPEHKLAFYRYATVEKNTGTDVPIALWRISEADERALDHYEGVPVYYSRKTEIVILNTGETAEGLIYLMEKHRMDPVPEDYYRRLERAYIRLGLADRVEDVLTHAKDMSRKQSD